MFRQLVNGLAQSHPREGPGLLRLHACFPFELFLPLSFLKAHVDTLMMGPGSEDSTWSPWPADDGGSSSFSHSLPVARPEDSQDKHKVFS